MYTRMPDTYRGGIDNASRASDVDDRRVGYVSLKKIKTPLVALLILISSYGCAYNKAASKPFIGSGPVKLTREQKADYIRRHGKTAGEEIADEEEGSKKAKTISGLVENALKVLLLGL
ncbi:MAG: hypothetical protein ABIG37_03685 [Nanoarchaeota archaeon]|nr:hypothetical protein [Nanoarchaeota archaeon]